MTEHILCILVRLKSWSARGASYHSAVMGNRPSISQTCLHLPTQWMSSPSRKCGVSPRLHLIVFVFRVNKEK